MTRLTLSQQVAELNEQIRCYRETVENQQAENAQLRAYNNSYQLQLAEFSKLNAQVATMMQDQEKLKKELDSAKSLHSHYSSENQRLNSEIEQCHAVLDSVEGCPSREYDHDGYKRTRALITRLAGAFLAIARNPAK